MAPVETIAGRGKNSAFGRVRGERVPFGLVCETDLGAEAVDLFSGEQG